MFSAKNSQSIDQLIYEALRNDLEERRHVDMVFSYYNEATGKVEHSTRCHRVALAAKSCLLQQLLYHSGFEEDRTLVLVGDGEMSADDDLVRLLYDPDKCGKDITLWDEEAVKFTEYPFKAEQDRVRKLLIGNSRMLDNKLEKYMNFELIAKVSE